MRRMFSWAYQIEKFFFFLLPLLETQKLAKMFCLWLPMYIFSNLNIQLEDLYRHGLDIFELQFVTLHHITFLAWPSIFPLGNYLKKNLLQWNVHRRLPDWLHFVTRSQQKLFARFSVLLAISDRVRDWKEFIMLFSRLWLTGKQKKSFISLEKFEMLSFF